MNTGPAGLIEEQTRYGPRQAGFMKRELTCLTTLAFPAFF